MPPPNTPPVHHVTKGAKTCHVSECFISLMTTVTPWCELTCPRVQSWKTCLSCTRLSSARCQGSATSFLPYSFFSARRLSRFPPLFRRALFARLRQPRIATAAVRTLGPKCSAVTFGVFGRGTLRLCPLPCRRRIFAGVAALLGRYPPRWKVGRSAGPYPEGSVARACEHRRGREPRKRV